MQSQRGRCQVSPPTRPWGVVKAQTHIMQHHSLSLQLGTLSTRQSSIIVRIEKIESRSWFAIRNEKMFGNSLRKLKIVVAMK